MSRLDTFTVALSTGTVEVPWESRQKLLAYLRGYSSSAGIVSVFDGAGTSQPVKLSRKQKEELLVRIEEWEEQLWSIHKLPEGLWNLRNVLHDDLDDRTT